MSTTENSAIKNDKNNSKVTANSYGNLDVVESGKECWMLRIPPNLASAWEDCPNGTVLGELVFRKGGGKGTNLKKIRPSLEVNVNPNVTNICVGTGGDSTNQHEQQKQQLPLHYSLQAMTKKVPTLHPFTRHPNGSVKVHGTVTRTANLQVIQDAKYRALCKSRILATTVHNNRFVKPVENNQIVQQSKSKGANTTKNKHMNTAANSTAKQGFGDAVHLFGKRLMESQQQQAAAYKLALATGIGRNGNKKARRFAPEEPVKSIIFQLYEDKPYWTTKDLRAASGGRPETEIKKVLQEIAIYHRSGEKKNTWELKKEFQSGHASGATGESRTA
mmetsp:Transcript_21874/g.46154  ORF Transcript_21874/g.46154 Transcript_21874/m.46154 type:complete len:332 (-) Transcript_21874:448-1443(-)|eukprot:CAMPEP_0201181718 /NCGR_PEP_ID=MMETSP0851-20130426/119404_1 /ASSEMBLY_ACC=CAM_ASM_000631 /TAXON_ID=183588 /ORGANISM="Pseudo-nitzschia fraudulenta, Strain WWA7" /LENGTH=331 /DNA_ID=CAMNT_0047466135 /DNA_START=105 /DNA_END=1103 /DNA_ORIENTATION=-